MEHHYAPCGLPPQQKQQRGSGGQGQGGGHGITYILTPQHATPSKLYTYARPQRWWGGGGGRGFLEREWGKRGATVDSPYSVQYQALPVVEADPHAPLLPGDHVAVHTEGRALGLHHIQGLQPCPPAPLLVHQLGVEVAVEGGDDGVGLVVPPLDDLLGLQLDHDDHVEGVGVEVVVGRGTHVHEALYVASPLLVAQLAGILFCT